MGKLIRVLLANRPRLIRELILTTFADQPDIEVVGEVTDEAKILETTEKTRPDLVIVVQDIRDKRPHICDVLLRRHPEVRIIALAPDQSYSVYYWASLDIRSHDVEPSEEGILGAVRDKANPVGGSK
jgi:DNA-binding NarL/FixJ family response regulator